MAGLLKTQKGSQSEEQKTWIQLRDVTVLLMAHYHFPFFVWKSCSHAAPMELWRESWRQEIQSKNAITSMGQKWRSAWRQGNRLYILSSMTRRSPKVLASIMLLENKRHLKHGTSTGWGDLSMLCSTSECREPLPTGFRGSKEAKDNRPLRGRPSTSSSMSSTKALDCSSSS